jgi:acyl-CoA synthetase (NDP forming)
VAECIDYFAQDPGTKVICAAIEGCQDGNRLRAALLKAVQNKKPVIIIKVGTSSVGIAAAATHTGSLAGNDAIYDAIFAECGAWRAQTIEEMLDVAYFCSKLPVPQNDQAGIVTVSGGIGILMADAAETHSITLPELPPVAIQKMVELLPFAPIGNPLDTTAQVTAVKDGTVRTVEIILTETNWSTLFLYMAQSACAPKRFEPMRLALIALKQRHPERSLILIGPSDDAVRLSLESDGFIVFEDPSRAVVAIEAMGQFGRAFAKPPGLPAPKLAPITLPSHNPSEAQAKQLLSQAGIASAPEEVCVETEAAVIAATKIGFPVVMKIVSPDILHKTDAGLVRLGVATADIAATVADLLARAAQAFPAARLDGVLAAPMHKGLAEVILGYRRDAEVGAVVVLGMGGVLAELTRRITARIAPVSLEEATGMIADLPELRLLQGFRGLPRGDVAALAAAIQALSTLAASDVAEAEINPLIIKPEGQGVVALDGLLLRMGD